MERPQVNIYIETSKKGPSRGKGVYGAIIEYETTKGPATLTIFKRCSKASDKALLRNDLYGMYIFYSCHVRMAPAMGKK